MSRNQKQTGFTLVELMISMIFVAFILIFISLVLIQMFRTYDKGASLKQMNQAGRSIIEDISQGVRSQLPANIVPNPAGGCLRVGDAIYVWNPMFTGGNYTDGKFNSTTNVNTTNQSSVDGDAATGPTMVRKKLTDPTVTGCNPTAAASETSALLTSQTRVLWAGVDVSDTRLVKLTFILGTYSRSEVLASGDAAKLKNGPFDNFYITPHIENDGRPSCLPGSAGNYCAFTEFSTIVYLSKEE